MNLQRKPRRALSASKTLNLTVVILVLTGIAAISWITINEFRIQQSVYTSILKQKLEATRSQFRMALAPFPNHLSTVQSWHDDGLLKLDDIEALKTLLIPLLDPTPQVTALYLVPAEGPAFYLTRRDSLWEARFEPADKDPSRQQLWYQHSINDTGGKPLHWSSYVFLPGLGSSGLVAGAHSGDLVIGLGMRKDFLDSFTQRAPITENGILVRRFEDDNLAWLTQKKAGGMNVIHSTDLLTSDLREHQIIGHALLAWGSQKRPYQQPLKFSLGRETWWCVMYPAIDGADPGELGLIVPVSDLSERLETVSGRVAILIGLVMALAMLALAVQAFSYARKWRRFSRRRLVPPRSEGALQLMIDKGESDQVEFKSTLRWNLKANKPGKEIEKGWLKSVVAFLNTNGGFLIIGVADDGTVLGLEADKFGNDDKFLLHFDNLIKQHIGLEYAGYIQGEIREVGEGRVFLIACDRFDEGVFLKFGDDEDFFIRMGPSTRALPGSRVLDYLRKRNS